MQCGTKTWLQLMSQLTLHRLVFTKNSAPRRVPLFHQTFHTVASILRWRKKRRARVLSYSFVLLLSLLQRNPTKKWEKQSNKESDYLTEQWNFCLNSFFSGADSFCSVSLSANEQRGRLINLQKSICQVANMGKWVGPHCEPKWNCALPDCKGGRKWAVHWRTGARSNL